MIITCCCSSFRRPRQVGHIIAMFNRQTHKDKRLIILDDGGSFKTPTVKTDEWWLMTAKKRFPSLGAKRNSCVDIALDIFPETEAIAPWDDDDGFLPWHLETMNAALENADWSLPSEVLYRNDDDSFRRHLTGPGKFYHSGHGYRLDAFRDSCGYPENLSGPEDRGLFLRLDAIMATICDPIALTGKPPSYVYGTNDGLLHISAHVKPNDTGADAYALCGQQPCEPTELVIEPPPHIELDNPRILGGCLPRPF